MVTPRWIATRLVDGRVRVTAHGRSLVADVVTDGPTTWVWIEGEFFELSSASGSSSEPRRRASSHATSDDALMPQMSAKVIRVLVTAGQHVHAGDTLVVLEAMKMEMPIRAPRSAEVVSVNCSEGDLVQPGTMVVTLKGSDPFSTGFPQGGDTPR